MNNIISISKITKFIDFNKDKLCINDLSLPKNKDIYILSIIGKARTGKSSLLNCIITNIINKDCDKLKQFKTSDSDEHCTHGVDACFIEYNNKLILILDVQGIEYHDSSLDTKMLLIIYLISNLIIFNEKHLICNATLQSLLPLTTFISCLELSSFNKPNIMFRISDCDLKLEPLKHLHKTLEKRQDQYQNIRETINELFIKIDCVITTSLDKSDKKYLNNNKYLEFLENEECNFLNICNDIIDNLLFCPLKFNSNNYINLTKEFSLNINENNKIDYNKLDINYQIAKNEILEWLNNNISENDFLDIQVNGTQHDVDTIITPFKNEFETKLDKFNKRFTNINSSIKDTYFNNIQNKYLAIYNTAIEKTISKATDSINNIIDCSFKNTFSNITFIFPNNENIILINNNTKYEYNYESIINDFIDRIKSSEQINIYHKETVDNICNKLFERFDYILQDLNEKKKVFNDFVINDKIDQIKEYSINNINNIWEVIKTTYIKDFTLNFENVRNLLIFNFINNLPDTIIDGLECSLYKNEIIDIKINVLNIDIKMLLHIEVFITSYNDKIKSVKDNFIKYRDNIAREILLTYDEEPNYGNLLNSKIKYPTYNLSILEYTYMDSNMYIKYNFVKEKLNNIFTKLYDFEYVKLVLFLDNYDYHNKDEIKNKLSKYYELILSDKIDDDIKKILKNDYINILFDIIIINL
jgi:hypothetical protein